MNSSSKQKICVTSGDYTIHHLDHLCVVAFMLKAPLLVDTPLLYETVKKYYPQVNPLYMEFHQEILELLGMNYDAVFVTVANYRRDLGPLIEMFYGKKMEFWYCPHGNSDKPLNQFSLQHRALIYGDQMHERLVKEGFIKNLERTARTGNIRRVFYSMHQSFYDELIEKEVFSHFAKKQTTILYAPTWQDFESSSSLFEVSMPLIKQLPDSFNLIVKIHPWLDEHQPGYVQLLQEKYQKRANVVILSKYPPVFPILERTDLYIGDFSSIGYDFLAYNRPMFFFDPKGRKECRENDSLLHECGMLIPAESYDRIFSFIETHLKEQGGFSEKRMRLYNYAFGRERSFAEICQNIGIF